MDYLAFKILECITIRQVITSQQARILTAPSRHVLPTYDLHIIDICYFVNLECTYN